MTERAPETTSTPGAFVEIIMPGTPLKMSLVQAILNGSPPSPDLLERYRHDMAAVDAATDISDAELDGIIIR